MSNLIIDIHGTRRDILENIGRNFDADIERLEESTKIDSVIHDKINEGYDGFIIVTKDTDKAQKYFEKKFSNIDIAVCSPDGKMSLREANDVVPPPAQQTIYYFKWNPSSLNDNEIKAAINFLTKASNDPTGQLYYFRDVNSGSPFSLKGIITVMLTVNNSYNFDLSKLKGRIHEVNADPAGVPSGNTFGEVKKDRIDIIKKVFDEIKSLPKEIIKTDAVKKLEGLKKATQVQNYLIYYKDSLTVPNGKSENGEIPLDEGMYNHYLKAKKVAEDLGLGGAIDTFNQNVLDTDKIAQLAHDIGSKIKKDNKDKEPDEKVSTDKVAYKWCYTESGGNLYQSLCGDLN